MEKDYSLHDVLKMAEAVRDRKTPPNTKKGQALYDGLDQYIQKSSEGIRLYVVKAYNEDGEEIAMRKYFADDFLDYPSPVLQIKDSIESVHPPAAVVARVFVSYDLRTLEQKPICEFPLYNLDLTTPDYTGD